MEKLILEQSYTKRVYILEIQEGDFDNHFRRYRMEFDLSPVCQVSCWLDFGTDNTLRVYEIEGRQRAESLARLGEFLSDGQWLKTLIELKTRY